MTAPSASLPALDPPIFDDTSQDFHTFLAAYRAAFPEDVLTVRDTVTANQDPTALVWTLAERNRHPVVVFDDVAGLGAPLVTNLFASRERSFVLHPRVSPFSAVLHEILL